MLGSAMTGLRLFSVLYSPMFKNIKGYAGRYKVTRDGRIRSNIKPGGAWLKPNVNSRGYLCVSLWVDGKQKTHHLHRLIALHFVPGYQEGLQVNHIDGNKLNNDLSNLEWCTASENMKHAYRNGLTKLPTKH